MQAIESKIGIGIIYHGKNTSTPKRKIAHFNTISPPRDPYDCVCCHRVLRNRFTRMQTDIMTGKEWKDRKEDLLTRRTDVSLGCRERQAGIQEAMLSVICIIGWGKCVRVWRENV
jgi:hypothetical protein